MGGCCSSPAVSAAEPDYGPFPKDGQKMRTDATLREVYRVGGTIGAGGFSKVKIVTHRESKKQYACKIMSLPPAGSTSRHDRIARRDTLREIDTVLDLDHPKIVGMREYFVQDDKVYLIMELLRGGELLDAVNTRGQYSEADARTIFRQLIEGVQYLHSRGVVHRDLKLDNLLLVNKGDITTVKIADFGIAKKEGSRGGLHAMRTVCGTSQYIAPEVIAAGKKVAPGSGAAPNVYGPACDLWSCGVVLFMLLGGQPPFWDDSQPTMLRKIMKGSFSFADHVWKSVSWQAKDLISRLLVVDPAKRLTCTQVLAHRWMTSDKDVSVKPLTETLEHMKEGSLHGRRRSGQCPHLHQVIADASHTAADSLLVETPPGTECPPSMAPSVAHSVAHSVSELP